MESSIAVFLLRHLAPEQLPTLGALPDIVFQIANSDVVAQGTVR
jgi:hypothetical protein